MSYLVVFAVAFVASGLTFFSGFGLGTLLLPAFALFFPVERAVALTAVVHFLNGLFKLALVARHADLPIVLRFGVPALLASLAGAWLLLWLSGIGPLVEYPLLGRTVRLTPVKLVVGLLLLAFGVAELAPRACDVSFGPRYLPLGGALSGFFGGLSGMQGALRSAFLSRADLPKEAFVATGVVVACLIDVSRLGVYARSLARESAHIDYWLLAGAVLSAFVGSVLGNRFLSAVTMRGVRRIVAGMLLLVALGLATGAL
ncbi:MAG TPA: sulfite exporter TauE/SafE family protein [Methylomirabilota bacterium]|nr:sulfite exporter TauE/SafE family protein [Methylomirabilota bacterium]